MWSSTDSSPFGLFPYTPSALRFAFNSDLAFVECLLIQTITWCFKCNIAFIARRWFKSRTLGRFNIGYYLVQDSLTKIFISLCAPWIFLPASASISVKMIVMLRLKSNCSNLQFLTVFSIMNEAILFWFICISKRSLSSFMELRLPMRQLTARLCFVSRHLFTP